MIIKFNLFRLSIILLLAIMVPLIQNQWLNLYLFDINNFIFYKFLYYLSGLIFPIIVCITSLNNFTFYKFDFTKISGNFISGKSLLIVIIIVVSTLSILISNYIYLSLRIFHSLASNDNKLLIDFYIDKQIIFILIISILLLFKKTKLFLKKIILLNFLIISSTYWYLKVNDIISNDMYTINNFLKLNDINYINLIFLLSIEILFFLWSYISYGSHLSDWKIPRLNKSEMITPTYTSVFYFLIFIYYSLLPS